MVTRKPVAGPPLDTTQSDGRNAQSNKPPYPATPIDSSKFPASVNSIYSPSLDSSPAFDLVDMEQARQKPQRKDSDVSSHGTWDSDDDEERQTPAEKDVPQPLRITPSKQRPGGEVDGIKEDGLPAALRPGPANGAIAAPRTSQEGQRYDKEPQVNPWANDPQSHGDGHVASNNPYLRAQPTGENAWPSQTSSPSNAPPAIPVELPTIHTPSDELSRMTLGGPASAQSFFPTNAVPVPPVVSQGAHDSAVSNPWKAQQPTPEEKWDSTPEVGYQPPPPGPPPKTHSLMDDERPLSLLDDPSSGFIGIHNDISPPVQPATQAPAPILIAPGSPGARGSGSVPETPSTRAKRQKSEHYQIKHINWLDESSSPDSRHRSGMRRSPILTQNANGPCPLLALVNALVLSTPRDVDTALIDTLRSREQVSLGLLLDAVFDELMSGRRGDTAQELPDVSELYAFLLALHTGMNVNPQFIAQGSPNLKTGGFEETKEMRFYATFGLPLVHGWTPPNSTPEHEAFVRTAQTFEDAQNAQFAEPELEDNLRHGVLSSTEQQTLDDIRTIKSFLSNWPTQLTDHGLEVMSRTLPPGQVAILFRNDHFSTLYKEPRHGALMTLVTDAGYDSHAEIVWESLVDVNGAASEMFSGDFRVVSHQQDARLNQGNSGGGEDGWETVPSRSRNPRHDGAPNSNVVGDENPPPLPGPRPTPLQESSAPEHVQLSASEQEDHDLALALQLQEEEEAEQRGAEAQRRREQELSEQFLSREHTASDLRPPVIPPRRGGGRQPSSSGRPPVNRTADPEAPPSYEQSRVDRPYREGDSTTLPVQGNPLNAYDALRRQQQPGPSLGTQQTGSIIGGPPMHGRRPSAGRGRRSSAGMSGAFGSVAPGGGMGRARPPPGTVQEAEERCSVM